MASERTWRVVPGSSFRWRKWDDEFVLYHDESGDTHRLNALGARVVESLVGTPLPTAELVRRLSGEFGAGKDADLAGTVHLLLEHLRGLGVVEHADTNDRREPQPPGTR